MLWMAKRMWNPWHDGFALDYPKLVTLMEELLKDGWIEEHVLSLEEFEEFLKKHTEETQSGAPKGEASVPTSKAIQPETVPDVVPLQKKNRSSAACQPGY